MDPKLLEILACPLEESRPPLQLKGQYLYCASCDRYFPIVNDIPHLLPESALTKDQIQDESKSA